MNNDDNNLDLLDLNDDADTLDDNLPDAAPFTNPRPKKPWLLLAVGVLVIILATYIIIRTIGGDSSSSMEVDLDAPAIVVEGQDGPITDAALAASLFHFGEVSIGGLKAYLAARGVPVRKEYRK